MSEPIHMTEKIEKTIIIPETAGGMRLDQALALLLTDYSRTQIQQWIKQSNIKVNDQPARPRDLVIGGEKITLFALQKTEPQWVAQPIALDIIYEDEALLVINKPVGMVVHPGAGNTDHTLLNALLYHLPDLQSLPRAGIVHRLDKNTSGLLVIAKTNVSYKSFIRQLKTRSMSRIYEAIVYGVLTGGGTINEPIHRDATQRKRMAVSELGKPAVTHYRIIERYRGFTRVKVQLETGRTHQIRVHFAYIHKGLLGDPTYGTRLQLPKGASPELIQELRQFKRQALHASELGLIHPLTNKPMHWQAPPPADMQQLISVLKQDILWKP